MSRSSEARRRLRRLKEREAGLGCRLCGRRDDHWHPPPGDPKRFEEEGDRRRRAREDSRPLGAR